MIGIKKEHSTKRIFNFIITINDRTWISRDNYFIRKKDAQKYINQNKENLEHLVKSIEYKKASPFDIPYPYNFKNAKPSKERA